jgi:type III pantothenate kinase
MKPILLLDLGNTRLKWALGRLAEEPASRQHSMGSSPAIGWRLGEVSALAHADPHFNEELELALQTLPEVSRVHLVAVTAEAKVEAVLHAVSAHVRSDASQPRRSRTQSSAAYGPNRMQRLICAYPQPDHLGTDRWLSLRGALALAAPPVLVVGVGTALTLDAIDGSGRHLGGLIVAGIACMREGLLARAPHLVAGSSAPRPSHFWADDTAPAVGLAPWQAAAGLVERAARRMQSDLGQAPAVLLAGGDAGTLAPLLEWPCRVEPDLVLRGLLESTLDG